MNKKTYTPPRTMRCAVMLEGAVCQTASNEPAQVKKGARVSDYTTIDNSSFGKDGDTDLGGITFD